MSSEPKNAAGEPSARKASKKSSKRPSDAAVNPSAASPSFATAGAMDGPSQLSMAPTAASPVPRLHDVPRIPIAEPKAAATGDSAPGGGGESKPRASKKRTASPPDAAIPASAGGPSMTSTSSIGASSSAPAADAAAVAAAAKDAAEGEREKQAAAARREAKRQRAKELEEAKHREELAKQAVEEAKRAEETRVREQRRKQELAALNANAEECQEEEEGQGDYEEDGFENYDDDFEDDATTQPAKARGNNDSSSSRADALSPAELKKIQQALQAESKELSTSRSSSASSKAGDNNSSSSSQSLQATGSEKKKKSSATSTSISSSIAGLKQSLDPRAKRAKEVLDARRFEVEKFNLFHQAPLSEQETYLSSLRRGQVRQVAVYTNDGAKAAAVQTKYPAGVDKSMHFPDDIGLDSEASTSGTGGGGDDDGVGAHSTVRFFKFLEHAAYACELLAEGNAAAAAAELELESTTSSARKRLSVSQSTPLSSHQVLPSKQFDDPAVEALLHGRDLVALRFSPCVSNILVACYGPLEACAASREHPPELAEVAALLKDKGVSCVWDVNQPHQALHVLKNEGQLSAVCLSPNRELIALAGTDDGSIHVWDLRRQPFRSASSKSARLVLCSPTYSTSGVDYKSPSQHASTIVGLEVVVRTSETYGSSAGGTFQFGSMDDRGIVIIWSLIEFEAGEDALIADKCVEIGGRVKMVMNTLIDTQQQYMVARPPPPRRLERTGTGNASLSTSRSATASLGDPVCSVGPIATVLKFFPSDPNQFVVGTRTGLVYRGHRFEKTQNAASRRVYRRGGGRASPRAMAAAAVVCVDFHPFSPEYFLVGYEDGGVCLFQCSAGTCLSSWDEMALGVSVSSVRWSTSRPGVFYASFSNAQVLVWDLTEQTHVSVPALETSSPVELASSLYPLALSSEKIRVSRPTIALRSGDSLPFQFALHELSQELATRSRDEALETATLLSHIL
ncbi:hypothetical protein PybrP1_000971 [[Pythium] brassicae (nom. inval.)]|nr:hypothetical protein PybrP1_000971 [[Pythium] brassicae (nom. inval.)]